MNCQATANVEDFSTAQQMDPNKPGRIEELLQQQNDLMLRHLRLAEDNGKKADCAQLMFHSPQSMLKALDPGAQETFKGWHAEFRSKVSVYVTQSQLLNQYRAVAARDELIAPFSDEAKRTWLWPECYVASARPREDQLQPVSEPGADFTSLRRKHAKEAQDFILLHQEACVQQLSAELALPRQFEVLVQRVLAWAALHKHFFQDPSRAEQLLRQQAQSFAELIFREEMSKADRQIQENTPTISPKLLLLLRLLCAFATLLSSVTLEGEHLLRLCAVLFALGCGMALFWEEKFMQSARALLVGLPNPWQLLSPLMLMLQPRPVLQQRAVLLSPRPVSAPGRVPAEEVN
mmetsp:Transcript_90044/g.160328  ORF Transcript_90044/g.160328 Transcript_90044/m.160328 type:complete len:348 (+) Transcript_90044:72-1115(+)